MVPHLLTRTQLAIPEIRDRAMELKQRQVINTCSNKARHLNDYPFILHPVLEVPVQA